MGRGVWRVWGHMGFAAGLMMNISFIFKGNSLELHQTFPHNLLNFDSPPPNQIPPSNSIRFLQQKSLELSFAEFFCFVEGPRRLDFVADSFCGDGELHRER